MFKTTGNLACTIVNLQMSPCEVRTQNFTTNSIKKKLLSMEELKKLRKLG